MAVKRKLKGTGVNVGDVKKKDGWSYGREQKRRGRKKNS